MRTPRTAVVAGAMLLLAACGGQDRIAVDNPVTASPAPRDSEPASAPAAAPSRPGATPTRSASATPSAASPTPSCPWAVCIDAPDGSAVVRSPVRVEGTAAVENGAITVEVRQGDRDSPLLGSATTTATRAAPERGSFSVEVRFAPAGEVGRIYAFATGNPAVHAWVAVPF